MAAVVIGALFAVAAVIAIIINLTGHNSSSTSATSERTSTRSNITVTDTITATTPMTVAARGPATPPPGAVECGAPTGGRYAHAAAGSDLTSCPFALNVRTAVNESNAQFPGVLQVYSPVTNQNYAMTCAVEQVLTCRGGNNAVVYVY